MSGARASLAALAILAVAGALPGSARAATSVSALTFTPLHADGVYAPGEQAGWRVSLAPAGERARGRYSYTITRDEKAVVKTGSFDLTSGSAEIDLPRGESGSFRVIVDYMAPPPPPPLTSAETRELNAAVRKLLIDTDPSLASILAKYPDYQFVRARRFHFQDLMEHRVATLTASVGAR